MLNGLDILILLRLSLESEGRIPSKTLAEELFISPPEVSSSLKRSQFSGLLSRSNSEKRVNRTGLLEFLSHGLRYVFPAERGSLTRGVPTGAAAEPLKAYFGQDNDPPPVWPYAHGTVRGYSFLPLHRQAPKAALRDARLYELLALVDAVRGERTRERKLAIDELTRRLKDGHA
jgi:hypothetical protein